MDQTYQPEIFEEKWIEKWERAARAKVDPTKMPYCILMPPPNVTGVLHMGHMLNGTFQDILVRRARQQGFETLWLPGTDHAGISLQTRVEKELQDKGIDPKSLSREDFLAYATDWRDQNRDTILSQFKRMGASCDYNRMTHTLDEDYSQAVLKAFVDLYHKGLIYRGFRMIHWCPVTQTALSDEEVVMRETPGYLYFVRYPLENSSQHIVVGTTRPETILGDLALAVHPNDERYRAYLGQYCLSPLNGERLQIIADEAIDPSFGTGVLKVTPSHSRVDFQIGEKHQLGVRDIFNPDGTLNALCGQFQGLERMKAREVIADFLKTTGKLEKVENCTHNVGFSERGHVPVEPRLSQQWFLRYPRVEEAKRAVEQGLIRFYPKHWEKTYLYWLNHLQDWCISRQLKWGHRIPVWYLKGEDPQQVKNRHVALKPPSDPENWEQDPDVLDTWASSWMWPLATLGWPDETQSLQKGLFFFYPTHTLITAPDIIFFWVARMIMAGLEFYGQKSSLPEERFLNDEEIQNRLPFKNVYFNGLVRDAQARKMSKSLGNSPDPLDLIRTYGADGVRLSLVLATSQGQDILFSEERVRLGRHFCNKLWNACRFFQKTYAGFTQRSFEPLVNTIQSASLDPIDKHLLDQLLCALEQHEKALERYEFNQAFSGLHDFLWYDFCDWSLELCKHRPKTPAIAAVQAFCLRQLLQSLFPAIPFITEELWQKLSFGSAGLSFESIHSAQKLREFLRLDLPETERKLMTDLRTWVSEVRKLKTAAGVANQKGICLKIVCEETQFLEQKKPIFESLLGIQISFCQKLPTTDDSKTGTWTPLGQVILAVSAPKRSLEQLQSEKEQILKNIENNRKKLESEAFMSRAPKHIIEGARKQLKENERRLTSLMGGELTQGLRPSCTKDTPLYSN